MNVTRSGLNTKKAKGWGNGRLASMATSKKARKAERKWKRFAKCDRETKQALDAICAKAEQFQRKRTYDISHFVRDQYECLLQLKKEKRLKKTLRAINEAMLVSARTNRMFGFVKRASIPEWDVRRISFTAGILDDALKADIGLEDIEDFRKAYARKRAETSW